MIKMMTTTRLTTAHHERDTGAGPTRDNDVLLNEPTVDANCLEHA